MVLNHRVHLPYLLLVMVRGTAITFSKFCTWPDWKVEPSHHMMISCPPLQHGTYPILQQVWWNLWFVWNQTNVLHFLLLTYPLKLHFLDLN
uniref:Uncharacterized protein n=1 Tax=Physcomitrium patens TaxID=3218 RepID=A0A2K1KAZ0_PHYPA|nr:hypothetical protein PHYPA_010128 [Physcomitrium patens]